MQGTGWRLALAAVFAVLGVALAACGTSTSNSGPKVFLTAFNRCLEKQGINDPENVAPPSPQELAIPSLFAVRGLRVPKGVTRVHFQEAVATCGGARLRVSPAPITNPIVRRRVGEISTCLANNGYTLPAPNFTGPGPVLDTSGVDIKSAKWTATALGCGVTKQLTQAELTRCLGAQALEGAAQSNSVFQARFLTLPHCLKSNGG